MNLTGVLPNNIKFQQLLHQLVSCNDFWEETRGEKTEAKHCPLAR